MKNILTIIALTYSILSISQNNIANISFTKEKHDFGKILEANGPVSCDFEFTNTGNIPLIISAVKASCGCTTPIWPKEPILPGKSGIITAKFDPNGRPHTFNKTITITSNAEQTNKIIIISGDVIAKEKSTYDYYGQTMDSLRLRSTHIAFLKTFKNETKTDTMSFFNPTDKDIKIEFENLNSHIKLSIEPEIIIQKKFALLTITYDARKKNDWGYIYDRIDVIFDGVKKPNNKLTISADIQENFESMTELEMLKAPKIEFETREYNFGTIKHGNSVEFEYKFKNIGKSDLIIRKTHASCGCTAIAPEKEIIKSGESSSFKVKFNSTGKHGHQNKTVTIITNDPNNSTLILKIVGDIID